MEERIQRTMKALERNKIKPYYVETREQLYGLVRELVKNDKLITAGGSMTLEESGVKELLMTEFKGVYLDRSEGKTPEEVEDILHKAFVSDTFFASSNAVTEDGALYNVDGRGNRVAAMIYGPAQVVLIVGTNKIVKDMGEAVCRVEFFQFAARAHKAGLDLAYTESVFLCYLLNRAGVPVTPYEYLAVVC